LQNLAIVKPGRLAVPIGWQPDRFGRIWLAPSISVSATSGVGAVVIQLDGPATTALLHRDASQAITDPPRADQGAAPCGHAVKRRPAADDDLQRVRG